MIVLGRVWRVVVRRLQLATRVCPNESAKWCAWLRRARASLSTARRRAVSACVAMAGLVTFIRRCTSEAAASSGWKRTKPNLYELCGLLPRYGVGAKLYRKSWLRNGYDPKDHHILVTKTELGGGDRRRQAWGVKYWKGAATTFWPTRVRSPLKREWACVGDASDAGDGGSGGAA